MEAKPVVPREQAHRDVEDAISRYLAENAESAASSFIDALAATHAHIARHHCQWITALFPRAETARLAILEAHFRLGSAAP